MKIWIVALSVIACVLTASCSDDSTVFNESSPVRAYDTEARILVRFVDIDRSTGGFVINPDKKLNASDYIVNRSREALMDVSAVNRDKFLREMNEVNDLLYSVNKSGISSAIIYSTYTSDVLVKGGKTDYIEVESLPWRPTASGSVAQMLVTTERYGSMLFDAPRQVKMNISASGRSIFYLYQINVGNSSDPDAGIVIVAGVNSPRQNNTYLVTDKSSDSYMSMSGINLIGDGTLSVSISE